MAMLNVIVVTVDVVVSDDHSNRDVNLIPEIRFSVLKPKIGSFSLATSF